MVYHIINEGDTEEKTLAIIKIKEEKERIRRLLHKKLNTCGYTWGDKFSIYYVGRAGGLMDFLNNMAIGL